MAQRKRNVRQSKNKEMIAITTSKSKWWTLWIKKR